MDCRVCGSESERILSGYDGLHLRCPGCGEFKINGSYLAEHSDRTFSVERTRNALDTARHNRPAEIPEIGPYMVTILD